MPASGADSPLRISVDDARLHLKTVHLQLQRGAFDRDALDCQKFNGEGAGAHKRERRRYRPNASCDPRLDGRSSMVVALESLKRLKPSRFLNGLNPLTLLIRVEVERIERFEHIYPMKSLRSIRHSVRVRP